MSGPGQPVTPQALGGLRAAIFGMWLVEVAPDPLSFWGELPGSMHEPIGVFRLVPEPMWNRILQPRRLDGMQKALVALLGASALGVRPYRLTAGVTTGLLTAHQALLRGFTFTNHEELGLLVSAYVLCVFPAADGFAWPGPRSQSAPAGTYAAAVDAMALLLVLPYCGIAARRLVNSAPQVFTDDSLPFWLGSLDSLDREARGIGRWVMGRPRLVSFLRAGFVVTTVFELLAPLCLILPRMRRAWVAVIVSMHLVNRVILKLFFWQNTALIVLLMTRTEQGAVVAWARRARLSVRRRRRERQL